MLIVVESQEMEQKVALDASAMQAEIEKSGHVARIEREATKERESAVIEARAAADAQSGILATGFASPRPSYDPRHSGSQQLAGKPGVRSSSRRVPGLAQ